MGKCVDLRCIDLQNQYFENAYFWSFNLIGANLRNITLQKVDIQSIFVEDALLDDLVGDHLSVCNFIIFDSSLQNIKISNSDIIGMDMFGVNLSNANFSNTKFTVFLAEINANNIIFTNCNISNTIPSRYNIFPENIFPYEYSKDLIFQQAKIVNSKIYLLGSWDILDFSNSYFEDVVIPYGNLHHPPLAKKIDFSKCIFNDVKFNEIDLTGAIFSHLTIYSAHFVDSKLENVIFEGLEVNDLTLEKTSLDDDFKAFLTKNSKCKFV